MHYQNLKTTQLIFYVRGIEPITCLFVFKNYSVNILHIIKKKLSKLKIYLKTTQLIFYIVCLAPGFIAIIFKNYSVNILRAKRCAVCGSY